MLVRNYKVSVFLEGQIYFSDSLVCVCENDAFVWGKTLNFRAFCENHGWCFSNLIDLLAGSCPWDMKDRSFL